MEAPKTPMHPFEVRISIGGGDWGYILRAVADIAKHFIERGPDHIGLCSGGGAVGATVLPHRPVPQGRQPGEVPAGARRRHEAVPRFHAASGRPAKGAAQVRERGQPAAIPVLAAPCPFGKRGPASMRVGAVSASI